MNRESAMSKSILAGILSISLCIGPALAHHNMGMIEFSTPIWVKATVLRYEPRNPHVLIWVEQKLADGQVKPMMVEGPNMLRLERMHLSKDFIKPGEVIELCAFAFRKDVIAQHNALPPGGPDLPALHVGLLMLPDGRKQPWGPYGKMDNCVRANDTAQVWVDFVNTDEIGRELWCRGMSYTTAPSVAPKALVEEVNRRMATPCS